MADERHGIEVGIDSTGAKAGEDKVVRSLENIKRKTEEVGKTGSQVGEQTAAGFGKAGAAADKAGRSMDGIRAKARGAGDSGSSAGDRAANAFNRATKNIDQATAAAARLHPPLRDIEASMGRVSRTRVFEMPNQSALGFVSSLTNIRNLLIGIGAVAAGQNIAQTAVQFKAFDQALKIVTGSTEAANAELAWAAQTANKLGFRVADITKGYVAFSAAAQGTSLAGEEQRHVFESITRAAAAYGLTNDQLKGSLLAVQQMIGKGTVSAEELRGQLGERLPGAVQIAARAMNMTTQQLFKMMEQGQLTSDVFLRRFAEQLDREIPKSARSANAAFNEFLTQLDKAKLAIANGGFFEGLTRGVASLAAAMEQMAASGTLQGIGSAIGKLLELLGNSLPLLKAAAIAFGVFFAAIKVQALVAFISQLVALEVALGATSTTAALAGVAMKGLQAIFRTFLGPMGLVVIGITALIEAWSHLSGVAEENDQRMAKINATFNDAADVLSKAKHWGDEAATAIASTGTDADTATPQIKEFAGEVGNAAQKLYDLAKARQADYIAQLQQKRQQASLQFSEAWQQTARGRAARAQAGHSQMAGASSLSEFFGGVGQAVSANLEDAWFGSSQEAELKEQMEKASKSMGMYDEAIQIAIKDLEHFAPKPGSSTTPAGKTGANNNYETRQVWTLDDVKKMIFGAGGNVTSGLRSYEKQKQLYDEWVSGGKKGMAPAKPGTSFHERGQAVDIVGMTVGQVRAATKGLPIKELFNEGDHIHLAWQKAGDAMSKANDELDEMQSKAERRLQLEGEFWMALKNDADVAGMLPGEAEKYNRELELRRILNDGELTNAKELTAEQKKRISDAVDLANKNKLIADMQGAGKQAMIDQIRLQDQQKALVSGTAEQVEDALALEERMWQYKEKALLLGLDLQDETIKKAWAELEAREKVNIALARKNREIAEGNALVDQLNRDAMTPSQRTRFDYEKELKKIEQSTRSKVERDVALKALKAKFASDMNEIADRFADEMLFNVHKIADAFGGAFGEVIDAIGSLAVIFNQMAQANYQAGTAGAKANNPISQALNGMKGITDLLSKSLNPKTGEFFKGISKILGTASDGAAIGQQVGAIGSMLFPNRKGIGIGSTIGGALGAVVGSIIPGVGTIIGGIVGSVLGGVVGGIFGGKEKKLDGSTTVKVVNGQLTTTARGDYKGETGQAGSAIQSGIESLASALGAGIGSYAVSIGVRDGSWRVDPEGLGRTKDSSSWGGASFGEDSESAIKFAIIDAIKDGALTGMSEATTRVLKSATVGTFDSKVKAATIYEEMIRQAQGLADPTKAAFDTWIKGTQQALQLLKNAGYSYDELLQLQSVFADAQKKMFEEMIKGYTDFIDEITKGPNSGKTVFDQFQDAMAAFRALVASGDYTQDQFTTAGQKAFDLARQVYGTATPQFEAIKAELVAATQGAIDAVTEAQQAAIDSAGIIAAIGEGTTQQEISNQILKSILDKLYGITPTPAPAPSDGGTVSTPPTTTTPTTGGTGSTTGTTPTPIPSNFNMPVIEDAPDLYSRTTRLAY